MRLFAAEPTVAGKGLKVLCGSLGVGGGFAQVVTAGIGQQGRWRWAPNVITARRGGGGEWLDQFNRKLD